MRTLLLILSFFVFVNTSNAQRVESEIRKTNAEVVYTLTCSGNACSLTTTIYSNGRQQGTSFSSGVNLNTGSEFIKDQIVRGDDSSIVVNGITYDIKYTGRIYSISSKGIVIYETRTIENARDFIKSIIVIGKP